MVFHPQASFDCISPSFLSSSLSFQSLPLLIIITTSFSLLLTSPLSLLFNSMKWSGVRFWGPKLKPNWEQVEEDEERNFWFYSIHFHISSFQVLFSFPSFLLLLLSEDLIEINVGCQPPNWCLFLLLEKIPLSPCFCLLESGVHDLRNDRDFTSWSNSLRTQRALVPATCKQCKWEKAVGNACNWCGEMRQ